VDAAKGRRALCAVEASGRHTAVNLTT